MCSSKNLHGELISFCIKLSNERHNDEYSNKAAALQASVKYAMFSAKQLKDIAHNLETCVNQRMTKNLI